MGVEILKNVKDCAVCQFWDGPRELSPNKNVRLKSSIDKGICLNSKNSPKKGKECPANQTACHGFIKWDKIP